MNLNSVTLIGHVTQDPVSRQLENKRVMTKYTIATNFRVGKDKEKKDGVEFHPVVTFGRLAEVCKEYLHKGRLVYVQGRMHTSKWEDDKKVLHASTEIVANQMLLLDKHQALVSAVSDEDADASEATVDLA